MRDQEIIGLQEAYLEVSEEVDTRRAPGEILDRLNASREGHMAHDGPNKPAYDARQRLLKKAHKKRTQVSEAHCEQLVSYLLDEGFASDEKSAEAILGAMSEGWRDVILTEKTKKTEVAPAAKTAADRAKQQNAVGAAIQANPEAFADAARKEAADRARRRGEHLANVDKNNR